MPGFWIPARRLALLVFSCAVLLAPTAAWSQTEGDVAELEQEYTREYTHTALAAVRLVHFPGWILDTWFARHANHWDGQGNLAYGAEYAFRKVGSFDLQVGLYWTDLSMQNAYWLESGKEDDLAAADYTKQGLSTLAAEISFFGYHDFIPEFGVFYGGGLWFGGILGKIEKANVNEACAMRVQGGTGSLNECTHDTVFAVEDGVPPVAGFLSVSAGLRAELEEHFIIKLEGGFKGYFWGGLAMGAQFW